MEPCLSSSTTMKTLFLTVSSSSLLLRATIHVTTTVRVGYTRDDDSEGRVLMKIANLRLYFKARSLHENNKRQQRLKDKKQQQQMHGS